MKKIENYNKSPKQGHESGHHSSNGHGSHHGHDSHHGHGHSNGSHDGHSSHGSHHGHGHSGHGRRKKGKSNKVLIIVILLLIAAFAGVFMYGNYIEKQRNAELANLETPPVETEIYGDETLGIDPGVDEKLQGYRNILFLGTDVPDENGQRSDGNIIISINKETKNVKIFSIARDTFMEVVPGSLEKITHAYMHGGKDQTLWALNHTMDLNIREVVVFELDDVANVVDRVGGVEVELTDRELEFLNQMVGPDNQVPGIGTQLLNGKQAVMYSRMRKDVDKLSDFRRNERLKIVMTEAMKKAQALEGEELITFAEATLDEIETNMRPDQILEMAQEADTYNIVQSDETFPFNFKGWTTDETGRVFVPITLESNIEKLYENYFGIYDYQPSETVKALNDNIIELTGYGKKSE